MTTIEVATTGSSQDKSEHQIRREADKNAGLKVITEAVQSGKAWPLKNAGLLKALIRAYIKSPEQGNWLLGRVLEEVRERVPAAERLLVPDQFDIGDKQEGGEIRLQLPRDEWFRHELRIQLVNAGAYWETLREHRADIEAAYRDREKKPVAVFNGEAAKHRAEEFSKLHPIPRFMRKSRANGKTARNGGKAESEKRKRDRSADDKVLRAKMKGVGGSSEKKEKRGR